MWSAWLCSVSGYFSVSMTGRHITLSIWNSWWAWKKMVIAMLGRVDLNTFLSLFLHIWAYIVSLIKSKQFCIKNNLGSTSISDFKFILQNHRTENGLMLAQKQIQRSLVFRPRFYCLVLCQLDTNLSHQRWENFKWENAFIRLSYRREGIILTWGTVGSRQLGQGAWTES